ncbi:hypothetical protein GCM10010302_32200 [Streptomyces polychromogenes]|uniref:Uncharacterized protein n=1 Tax=Streptomyces polychromogenes TaxID=67342 RepID=A0ABN0VDS3_9ACTN
MNAEIRPYARRAVISASRSRPRTRDPYGLGGLSPGRLWQTLRRLLAAGCRLFWSEGRRRVDPAGRLLERRRAGVFRRERVLWAAFN